MDNSKHTGMRLPADVWEQVNRIASAEDRPVSRVLLELLRIGLEERPNRKQSNQESVNG